MIRNLKNFCPRLPLPWASAQAARHNALTVRLRGDLGRGQCHGLVGKRKRQNGYRTPGSIGWISHGSDGDVVRNFMAQVPQMPMMICLVVSSAALCFHFNGRGRLQLCCTVMWLMRQEWQEAMSWFRTSRQHTKLSGISIYSDILALCLAFSLACVGAQVWSASGAGEKNSLRPAVAD